MKTHSGGWIKLVTVNEIHLNLAQLQVYFWDHWRIWSFMMWLTINFHALTSSIYRYRVRLVLGLGPNSEVIVTRCIGHFSVYQSRALLGICSHHFFLTFVNLFCGHSYTCICEGLFSVLLCTHLLEVAYNILGNSKLPSSGQRCMKVPCSRLPRQHLLLSVFYFRNPSVPQVAYHSGDMFTSLVTSCVEHLFSYVLGICISPLRMFLSKFFASF